MRKIAGVKFGFSCTAEVSQVILDSFSKCRVLNLICKRESARLQIISEENIMLDVNKIGQKIGSFRKSFNMTQAALAEKLFVSYQAVSSWERGLTLPDIDKLKDLSELFGCSIEDIIGEDGREAEAIVDGKAPRLEDISAVAQIIEPKKLDELVKTAIEADDDWHKAPHAIGNIIALAPFIGKELLGKLLDESECLNLDEVTALLPFLGSEKLNDIADKTVIDDPQKLLILAPFLDKSKLDALVDKIGVGKAENLIVLAPFLSREKLVELTNKYGDTAPALVNMLAPFITEKKQ